ncbi:hypothetical protein EI427_15565 [Flammeovirga pectinis]|uniref:DoxX family protein n=1 Tax=Flammeovirga pectinis TaxID=2494373 RepID=A0A3S9P5Y1_9BACT|nr:hypothetical protein [Flammeovirga pectinis]AZQ63588.1 hypothetical protein EI427_15565 [Flammeovirga pectinis]
MQKDFKIHKVLSYWALRAIPVVVLFQSLLYKMGEDPESVYIYYQLGLGDDIRLFIAVVEFIACFLLVYRSLCKWGAWIAVVLTSFQLLAQIFILGIDLPVEEGLSNGMQLFGMSLVTLLTCLLIIEQESRKSTYFKQKTSYMESS